MKRYFIEIYLTAGSHILIRTILPKTALAANGPQETYPHLVHNKTKKKRIAVKLPSDSCSATTYTVAVGAFALFFSFSALMNLFLVEV